MDCNLNVVCAVNNAVESARRMPCSMSNVVGQPGAATFRNSSAVAHFNAGTAIKACLALRAFGSHGGSLPRTMSAIEIFAGSTTGASIFMSLAVNTVRIRTSV